MSGCGGGGGGGGGTADPLPPPDTAGWLIAIIDNAADSNTSIGIDSSGSVHISYYAGILKYATNTSGD